MFSWVITEKSQLQDLLDNGFTIGDLDSQKDWSGLHVYLTGKSIFWCNVEGNEDNTVDPYIKNFTYAHYKQYQLLVSLGMSESDVIKTLREISL